MLVIKDVESLNKLTELGFDFKEETYDVDGKIVNVKYYEWKFKGVSLIRVSTLRNIYITPIDSPVLAEYQSAIYEKLYDMISTGVVEKL